MLRKRIRDTMGSLRAFSQRPWASLTETSIDLERLRRMLETRIQLRFDTSWAPAPRPARCLPPP